MVDGTGRAAHRNGFELIDCRTVGETAVAVSRAHLHWVDTAADTGPDHGSGRAGPVRRGPTVTMASVLRGSIEVRIARIDTVDGLSDDTVLEMSGWPVAAAEPPVVAPGDGRGRCSVTGNNLTSRLVGSGEWETSVRRERSTSPLGEHVAVPRLRATSPPRRRS